LPSNTKHTHHLHSRQLIRPIQLHLWPRLLSQRRD
jgi:hypothetical protein